MQLSNAPSKLVLPFANAGAKNDIPVDSQVGITAGAASLTDGFPPLTRTPIAAGGVPPSGLDMNGILYNLSALLRWMNAGAGFPYDGAFAGDSNVGGYPKGARVMRSDGAGYWLNTIDGNTVDPESVTVGQAALAGWVPDLTNGVAAVTMTGSNVTLTPLQYGKPIISLSGALTANLNLIFPDMPGEWTIANNCTGNFAVTAKTASGTGVTIKPGRTRKVWGNGTNIYSAVNESDTPAQFDASQAIATMEAVYRAIGGYQANYSYGTGEQTIPPSQANSFINLFGTATTITLPLLSSVRVGSAFTFAGSLACAINRSGTDTIFANGSNPSLTSVTVGDGESLTLVAGANQWLVIGTSALQYGANFGASLAANGYQKLPGGLILQWGNDGSSATSSAVTFPIAFPSAVRSIVATLYATSTGGHVSVVTPGPSLTGFNLTKSAGISANWWAIGH